MDVMNEIMTSVDSEIFGIWFLIGASFVFFMQAGFAMVETGFTRAKNAGNIIMKNLMDFCIGTVVFITLGFGLFLGEDALGGLIGLPTLGIFTDYANFDWSNFVFNLVFCATTATIVSGAMAERTKFLSYCVYSAVISGIIYPIEAHWIWGGGWLSQLGFHDFAGSCAIHMVGGISALIGAAMEGARIGKFKRDKDGKVIKVNAIPGHNLTIGALGCFILWFGWYGFNGAAATSGGQLASIFVATTIAPAIATFTCMVFTWLKYGKPDVSMCLNASLAGLVGVTAGCDAVDALGAILIGIVSGLLVVFGVWLLDHVLHIDDPVGAVAVHMCNGIWGTFAVGLFATTSVPGNDSVTGLFYGGGFHQLGLQCLAILTVGVWTAVTISLTFLVIKKTLGLRATAEEEIIGLDLTEHGLSSSYADFAPSADTMLQVNRQATRHAVDTGEMRNVFGSDIDRLNTASTASTVEKNTDPVVIDARSATNAPKSGAKLTKLSIVCRPGKLEELQASLAAVGINGITVTHVLGYGTQMGHTAYYRGIKQELPSLHSKIKVEAVITAVPVEKALAAARKALYTGNIGDGKIFIYDVEDVVKVRTNEHGYDALQDSPN
ncbi:MAG: ammonium transporter [Oscillospiraceae bacterium]|nr:ammonium transporter [Oscillospiraceae bacterium]